MLVLSPLWIALKTASPALVLSPLWISLKTACTATLLAFLLGTAAAYGMVVYRGPHRVKGLLDGLLTLPLVLPPTVVGFLLLLLLGQRGPVGQLLSQWGLSLIFSWGAIVVAATVVAFPLMYKTVLAAFEQVDPTLLQVARTLGASEWRLFWQVLVPLAWPGILAGVVLTFARALGEFGATLMVGGSIPGVTQTMPMAIFFSAEAGRMGVASAWVIVMVAVALGVIGTLASGADQSLGLGQFPRIHGWGLRMTKSSRTARSSDPATPPSPELSINVAQSLSGFQLAVNLSTGQEPLGVLGASGAGKSMMLRCIAGLETPDRGRIVLNGRVLFDAATGVNVRSCDRNIGVVFQNYALFPHLTVAQNIAFGINADPFKDQLKQQQTITHWLDTLELTGLDHRYPHQLSGGQQQRVALARAMAMEPDLLLLDEPLSALDTYLRSHIEKLLHTLLSNYEGITLFITHKLEEVYRLCPRLIILSHGQVAAMGTREDIFRYPPTVEVARVTECKNLALAHRIAPEQVNIPAWNCQLQVTIPPSMKMTDKLWVGIRAHHIQLLPFSMVLDRPNNSLVNIFAGWLAMASETQHRVTLYIKLNSTPNSPQDYHLQAEVYREKWENLKNRPMPWSIHLAVDHVILMSTDSADSIS